MEYYMDMNMLMNKIVLVMLDKNLDMVKFVELTISIDGDDDD